MNNLQREKRDRQRNNGGQTDRKKEDRKNTHANKQTGIKKE